MLFTRSDFSCESQTPWNEQFNGVTSFLDASTVYGSTSKRTYELRGGARRRDGRLFSNEERLAKFDLPNRQELGINFLPSKKKPFL